MDTEGRWHEDIQGGHMTTAAEIAVLQLQAKECQGFLAAPRSWKRQGRILPWSLQGTAWPCQHFISDSDHQNCERMFLFKPLSLR